MMKPIRLLLSSTLSEMPRYPLHGGGPPYSTELIKMGSLSTESFEEFLESLKKAGVAITNERELRERLAEAQRWRYAFATLATNGRPLGIRFQDPAEKVSEDEIHRTFMQFDFPEGTEAAFAASLKSTH